MDGSDGERRRQRYDFVRNYYQALSNATLRLPFCVFFVTGFFEARPGTVSAGVSALRIPFAQL
jgi:hypothetical protein